MAELRHYRYFVEIAKRGTFTAAAEALNMTQSALSEQILQLERECGSQLFNRRHSGITLTPAGDYLPPQAEAPPAKASEAPELLPPSPPPHPHPPPLRPPLPPPPP